MSRSSMTVREANDRERKVGRICRYLQSCAVSAEEASRYTKAEWAEVAKQAGTRKPSETSVASVLHRMETGRDMPLLDQLEVER